MRRSRARSRAVLIALAIAAYGATTHGHHSIAGIYDSRDQVTIDGSIARFHFVNPHPFVMVDVKGRGGAVEQWRLEMDNRFELEGIGMSGDTLKPGDRVVARGSRGREQPTHMYVRRLDRPADGFWYEQVGSSPRSSVRR